MILRFCPDCNKAFYARMDGLHTTCLHCGYIILDRRDRKRVASEINLVCQIGRRNFMACLTDYSGCGLRISYKGKGIKRDTLLTLNIEELGLSCTARAVWTVNVAGQGVLSGLNILG